MKRILYLAGGAVVAAFAANAAQLPEFSALDVNADGYVVESEFVRWKTADGSSTEADAVALFKSLDSNSDGALDEAELAAMKDSMGQADESQMSPGTNDF